MLLRGQCQSSQRGILRTLTLTCRATLASGLGHQTPTLSQSRKGAAQGRSFSFCPCDPTFLNPDVRWSCPLSLSPWEGHAFQKLWLTTGWAKEFFQVQPKQTHLWVHRSAHGLMASLVRDQRLGDSRGETPCPSPGPVTFCPVCTRGGHFT